MIFREQGGLYRFTVSQTLTEDTASSRVTG